MKKLVFLLAFLTAFACKSSKKKQIIAPPITNEIVTETSNNTDVLRMIEANAKTPEWFSSKGSISATMNGNMLDVDAVIQIRKDSAILLVVKKFGFEGARALITPDSVFLINRLEQSYDKMPLSVLAQRFNMPPHFDAIQQLFIGNPTKLDKSKAYQLTLQDSMILLNTNQGTIGGSYAFAKKGLRLRKAFFEDENTASKMTMIFENYKISALNKEFSQQRFINFFSPQTGNGEIEINFSDIEFNVPKTMRFQIPSHYQKTKIIKD